MTEKVMRSTEKKKKTRQVENSMFVPERMEASQQPPEEREHQGQ